MVCATVRPLFVRVIAPLSFLMAPWQKKDHQKIWQRKMVCMPIW